MNKGQRIVSWGILITILALLILEVWSLANGHKSDTISEIVHEASRRWPIITFLLGLLMGHWIWPIYSKPNESK